MPEYMILEKDIPTMVQSLTELFSESEAVSLKQLAGMMSVKLGYKVSNSKARYLVRAFGFYTNRATGRRDRNLKIILHDADLLDNLKERFLEVPV
ncbi:MAG: hypothetical protein PHQ86_09625 [Dehalococcoidales bacterium]|nr:hypothetical protein [Dehalococcoidales bacterium]